MFDPALQVISCAALFGAAFLQSYIYPADAYINIDIVAGRLSCHQIRGSNLQERNAAVTPLNTPGHNRFDTGGRRDFPQLEGVKLNGHWAVIYSKYDLGCALERHQGLDCKGYSYDSALQIAANVVIYATLP